MHKIAICDRDDKNTLDTKIPGFRVCVLLLVAETIFLSRKTWFLGKSQTIFRRPKLEEARTRIGGLRVDCRKQIARILIPRF